MGISLFGYTMEMPSGEAEVITGLQGQVRKGSNGLPIGMEKRTAILYLKAVYIRLTPLCIMEYALQIMECPERLA
jgi:hypothetical protein